MYDKIKNTLSSGKACYLSAQPFVLPLPMYEYKDQNIQNYKCCRLYYTGRKLDHSP